MSRSLFPGKLKKGYLIKSPPLDGAAFKKMFKAWKRRWCVLYLSDGKLYFQYYENEEKSHTGCPKNTLLLEECLEITFDLEHPEYDHVFSLTLPERTYYFSAVSEFEMTDWVDKICEPLDLKRATLLKVQKSVRRAATLNTSSNTSSPGHVISPPSLFFRGGCHTLPSPWSPSGVTITPPLPPRYPPPNPFNGVAGFCTLPQQPAVKTMSIDNSECPPLPVRSRSRDQNDALPPLPPPHNPLRGRASVDIGPGLVIGSPINKSTGSIDSSDAPPLPARPRSCSDESPVFKEADDTVPPLPPKPQQTSIPKPPMIPPRKTSTTDYVNYEILPIPEKRPVPAPRTKKPITDNN